MKNCPSLQSNGSSFRIVDIIIIFLDVSKFNENLFQCRLAKAVFFNVQFFPNCNQKLNHNYRFKTHSDYGKVKKCRVTTHLFRVIRRCRPERQYSLEQRWRWRGLRNSPEQWRWGKDGRWRPSEGLCARCAQLPRCSARQDRSFPTPSSLTSTQANNQFRSDFSDAGPYPNTWQKNHTNSKLQASNFYKLSIHFIAIDFTEFRCIPNAFGL